MAYIDYDHYTKEFQGTTIMEDEFPRLATVASDVIDSLSNVPFRFDELPAESQALVRKATAYQVEVLFLQGGVDAIVGMSASSADSESLADYRISKGATVASSASKVILPSIGGIPVSQMAITLLRRAGLMSRWAYARPPKAGCFGNQ